MKNGGARLALDLRFAQSILRQCTAFCALKVGSNST